MDNRYADFTALKNQPFIGDDSQLYVYDNEDEKYILPIEKYISEDLHGLPSGGTTGQVLAKNSNTDYDVTWVPGGGDIEIATEDKAGIVKSTSSEIEGAVGVNSEGVMSLNNFSNYMVWDTIDQKEFSGVFRFNHPQYGFYTITEPEHLTTKQYVDSQSGGGASLSALFIARGATYDSTTKLYSLNGLTDLTEDEMAYIYSISSAFISPNAAYMYARIRNLRTIYPIVQTFVAGNFDGTGMFNGCQEIESIDMTGVLIKKAKAMFGACYKLKTCKVWFIGVEDNPFDAFDYCLVLQDLELKGLATSLSFLNSPLLTRESVLFMINNSEAQSPITLTLNATTKGLLTPEDITLATSKNITIA